LIVPVLHDADRKSLAEIAREVDRLTSAARAGKLKLEELKGGTFTITSIGNFGGLFATPIINAPQVGILGVGKIAKRPIYDEQGQRIGHLRRNQLSAAGSSRFAVSITTAPDATIDDPLTVTVSDRATGNTTIEVYLFQRRKIRLTCGNFYTHKGELVSISPHYCRIGTGLTRFGDVVESRGGIAVIG